MRKERKMAKRRKVDETEIETKTKIIKARRKKLLQLLTKAGNNTESKEALKRQTLINRKMTQVKPKRPNKDQKLLSLKTRGEDRKRMEMPRKRIREEKLPR